MERERDIDEFIGIREVKNYNDVFDAPRHWCTPMVDYQLPINVNPYANRVELGLPCRPFGRVNEARTQPWMVSSESGQPAVEVCEGGPDLVSA